MQIDWNRLNDESFERMVTTLLSRMRGTVRVDGSGGDGGRDAHFRDETGYHIFEVKWFHPGRLSNGGRKRQIIRSFDAAKKHGPTSWTLILGLQPTDQEAEWLNQIGKGTGIRVEWHGLDWLESQLATYPDIVRYFMSDVRQEILQDLALVGRMHEGALDDGIDDVLRVMGDYSRRINEISPYWSIHISSEDGAEQVSLRPKYPGAEKDEPLSVEVQINDRDVAAKFAQDMERLTNYGVPVNVIGEDAAACVITPRPSQLLGQPKTPERILVSPIPHRPNMEIAAVVADAGGVELARQKMTITQSSVGRRGIYLHAENEAGTFNMDVVIDQVAESLSVSFAPLVGAHTTPAEMAGVFAWLDELHQGHELRVLEARTEKPLFSGKAVSSETSFHRERTAFENMARLQAHTQITFPIPDVLTAEDLEAIQVAADLLDSGVAQVPWSEVELRVTFTGDVEKLLEENIQLTIDATDIEIPIGVHRVPLGVGRIIYPDAVVSNVEEVRNGAQGAREVTLRITPGKTRKPYSIYLTPEEEAA